MKLWNCKEKMGAGINCSPSTETTAVDRVASVLDICVVFLIGIFLLTAPYPHLTAIKEITYYLSVAFLVFLIWHRKDDFYIKTPLTLPFATFFLWAVISIFFAINKGNTSHDVYAHLLKYIVFYFMLINFFNTRRRFLALTWIMIMAATVLCLGGFIYFYIILENKLSIRFLIDRSCYIPYLDYLYIFAVLLSCNHLLASWNQREKYLSLIPLFIISLGAILAQTRSAFFAFMVSSIFFFRTKLKMWFFATLLLLAAVAVVLHAGNRLTDFKTFLHNERFDNARIYLEIIKDHPLTGIGFGMQSYDDMNLLVYYYEKIPVNDRPNRSYMFLSPHNLLIDITVRLGIVGLILFGFLIFRLIKMGWQTIRRAKDDFIRGGDPVSWPAS
jgi:O-antigen ligase